VRSARGGRVSRGVGTTVPAGAGAFHDRVRDGTGWVRAALDHGRAAPTLAINEACYDTNDATIDDENTGICRAIALIVKER